MLLTPAAPAPAQVSVRHLPRPGRRRRFLPAVGSAAPSLLAMLAATMPAPAAITWNGGNGDGDFASAANWGGTDPDGDLDGVLDDGALIFAGAVQTTVMIDLDYSGIDSIVFDTDADTFTLDGVDGDEVLTFNDAASIINNSTVAGDITFGGNLTLQFTGGSGSITNNDVDGDSAIVIASTIDLADATRLRIGGTGDVIISGVIGGESGGLTWEGTGTLTLSGANTYGNGTTLSAGTVLIGDAAAFGTGFVTVDGDTTLGATGGAIAGVANQFLVGTGVVLTIGGSEDLELAGAITGSGSLLVDMDDASDTLTLSASSGGLLGGVELAQGTIEVSAANALGAGPLTVTGTDGQAILQAGVGDIEVGNAIILDDGMGTAVLDVTGANALTLSGQITGDGDLEVGLDSGTFLTLSGDNSGWSGDLVFDNAGAGVALGSDAAIGTGQIRLEADGRLRATGGDRTLAANIDLAAATLTINAGSNLDVTGVISGGGVLAIDAAGTTVTLSGVNTHTGSTSLSNGTLILATNDALGDVGGGAVLFISGGEIGTGGAEISIAAPITVAGDFGFADPAGGSLELSGAIDLGDAARTITSEAFDDVILSGTISSTGQDDGLVKDGGGQLILSGDNSAWNGGVTLSRGSLGIGHDSALGGGGMTVDGDATIFAFGGPRTIANAIDIVTSTLTITGEEDLVLDGAITESADPASIIVNSDGAVTFNSNASTYSGGTTIVSGDVVVGDSEALGTGDITFTGGTLAAGAPGVSLDEAVIAAGEFTIQGAEDLTLAGVVSGTFDITVDFDADATTLTLSGANDFTGDLRIDQGRVALEGGAALADSVAVLFGGEDAGTLVLAADETIGSLGGGDAADGVDLGAFTLTLGGAAATAEAFGGVISGTGGLSITGGTHLLDGASTFTGDTIVSGGTLGGDGSLAGSLEIQDGGTFDAGAVDAIGDFTVGGDFALASGATWVVGISGSDLTMFDTLTVGGSGTLASGSVIQVDLAQSQGTYIVSGQAFEILSAAGGITDGGVSVESGSATLAFYFLESFGVDPDFQGGDLTLSIVANRAADAFSDPSYVDGGNNRRIGAALDALIPIADANVGQGGAAQLLAQLQPLNAADLNTALTELAPTAAAAPASVAISGVSSFTGIQGGYLAARRDGLADVFMASASLSNPASLSTAVPAGAIASAAAEPWVFGEAIRDRSRSEDDLTASGPADRYGMNVWAKLYAFQSDLESEGDRTGYDGDFAGGQAGVDWRVSDSVIVGLGIGLMDSDVDLAGGRGSLDGENFRVGPYASWTGEDWYVDASLSFGMGDYDQTRVIRVPGQPVQTARGDYDGDDLSGALTVGRAMQFGNGWRVTPALTLQYATFDFDGYTETGAGVQNLAISDRSQDSLRSRLGVTVSRRFTGDRLTFVPELTLGWEHEFEDYDDVEAAFVVGGGPFTVGVGSPLEDAFVLGGGVTVMLDERLAGFVRYDGTWASGGDTQGVTLGLSISF